MLISGRIFFPWQSIDVHNASQASLLFSLDSPPVFTTHLEGRGGPSSKEGETAEVGAVMALWGCDATDWGGVDERPYRERDRDRDRDRGRQGERSRSPSPSPEGAQSREDDVVDDLGSRSTPASPPPPSSSLSSVAFQKPGKGRGSRSSRVCHRAAAAEFVVVGGRATTIRRRRHDDDKSHGRFHRRGPGSGTSRPDGRGGGVAPRWRRPPPPAPPFAAASVNDNSAAAEVADAEGASPLHRCLAGSSWRELHALLPTFSCRHSPPTRGTIITGRTTKGTDEDERDERGGGRGEGGGDGGGGGHRRPR